MTKNEMPPWVEKLTAVLLSVAGLSTAWASYQATLWNGEQVSRYSEANGHLTVASQLDLQAGQIASFDTILFAAWVAATDAGKSDRARFLEERFSSQFATAFDAWRLYLAEPAIEGATPKERPTPKMPLPLYTETHDAQVRRAAATEAFSAGDIANRTASWFVAATVLLSTVLFLGGISQIMKRLWPRLAVLALASVICVGALIWLTTLPTASF